MEVKAFNYKKVLFGSYRLHDWKAPLNGMKMEEHISRMASEGWKMGPQVSTSKDMITITFTKE